MERRSFLTLLATPAALALLQACGSSDKSSPGATAGPSTSTGPTTTAAPGESREARSSLARVSADPGLAAGGARAINALAADMYQRLASREAGNIVFSSASVMLALAMTRGGALGKTASEMDKVLHVDETGGAPQAIHPALNALTAALGSRSGIFAVADQQLSVELAIANSLWGQGDVEWKSPFLDLLASQYGAGMRLVDYRTNPETARRAINEWVGVQTKDRIPELLAQGTITPDVVLTLVNAIYLKAPWLEPFTESATANEPFKVSAGNIVRVPIMHTRQALPYAAGAGWQAVQLAYVGGSLAMTIVVPDAGRLAEVEGELGSGLLERVTEALSASDVNLRLPRFNVETKVELAGVMAALGMPTALNPTAADFSGMTAERQLYIGLIVHQANITVDEKGTEAAAATAVVMRETSAPADPPVNLSIDRPFLYAVRDIPTGAVLFLGRVADPS